MNFDSVVFDDNGPGGRPGTFLGAVSATANAIPVAGGFQFYPVDLRGLTGLLPDSSVYVGVRWPGGGIALCGDSSPSIPQRTNYGSGDGGTSWTNLQTLFPSAPPRALSVRLDPGAGSATGSCTPSSTSLCLNGNRFRVQATYQTGSGQSGAAQVVKLTDESGYLTFFSASNVEVVIKVLDACSFNQRFWVYAAGLTDVRVVITVTDTANGSSRVYTNPQGQAFAPILDSSAFATCP
jgi:hypothetical protein